MMSKWVYFTALVLSFMFFYLTPSQAAKFANQFAEFELPPQWQCNLEGAEWVCQSTVESKKREAIIILAAKLKGDQDSLDQYLAYLKNAKVYSSVQGKPITSEPKYAKTIEINGQVWVDSLHGDSEIPGFFTRYLATVKADIGVLITYSVNKKKYQEYIQDFDNLAKTLKVFRRAGGINAASSDKNILQQPIPPSIQQDTVFQPSVSTERDYSKPKAGKKDNLSFILILLAAGAVAFIIWKKRQAG
jgi:hypothetical protein